MHSATILISTARSGTNFFLAAYKNLFPKKLLLGEIFRNSGDSLQILQNELRLSEKEVFMLLSADPLALWIKIQSCKSAESGMIAKIFYYHARRFPELWDHFSQSNRIVHLIRKNPFDIIVSHKLAQLSGQWKSYDSSKDTRQIEICPTEIADYIETQKRYVDGVRHQYSGGLYTEMYYEDIAESTDSCVKAICSVYGISEPDAPIQVDLKKQNLLPHSERIKNYAEIKQFDVPAH